MSKGIFLNRKFQVISSREREHIVVTSGRISGWILATYCTVKISQIGRHTVFRGLDWSGVDL